MWKLFCSYVFLAKIPNPDIEIYVLWFGSFSLGKESIRTNENKIKEIKNLKFVCYLGTTMRRRMGRREMADVLVEERRPNRLLSHFPHIL